MEFIRSYFNLDPAQVPRLYIKTNILHNDSFYDCQASSLGQVESSLLSNIVQSLVFYIELHNIQSSYHETLAS
jgi:hypothetical protein